MPFQNTNTPRGTSLRLNSAAASARRAGNFAVYVVFVLSFCFAVAIVLGLIA